MVLNPRPSHMLWAVGKRASRLLPRLRISSKSAINDVYGSKVKDPSGILGLWNYVFVYSIHRVLIDEIANAVTFAFTSDEFQLVPVNGWIHLWASVIYETRSAETWADRCTETTPCEFPGATWRSVTPTLQWYQSVETNTPLGGCVACQERHVTRAVRVAGNWVSIQVQETVVPSICCIIVKLKIF